MKILLIALLAVAGIFYALSDYIFPHTWKYEITVEVETPDGIKSGSAVREVHAKKNMARFVNPGVRSIKYEVFGEAVVVDLEQYGALVYLVGSHDDVQNAFDLKIINFKDISTLQNLNTGNSKNLTDDHYFIIYKDIDDPRSVSSLLYSEFEEYFKGEVSLKEVSIQITNDPVSFGNVKSKLSWIDVEPVGLTFANPDIKDPAQYLSKSSFIRR